MKSISILVLFTLAAAALGNVLPPNAHVIGPFGTADGWGENVAVSGATAHSGAAASKADTGGAAIAAAGPGGAIGVASDGWGPTPAM
ncbi:hypothetical protein FGB62_6g315 [Gracilaria domingensis]|nr:hypothetical protein FGB62_6g315 [Gracilaria domingensis]